MKLEGHIYCDGPDCDTHTHISVDAMAQGRLPAFIKVIEYSHIDHVLAFCSYDCVMKHFAQFPPTEDIPLFGGEGE